MKTTRNELFSETLQDSINDYYGLLSKGYPQKSILKLVGDRYKLTGYQRSLLYRGVCKKEEVEHRKTKIITSPKPECPIYIDGYNVLLTMANYLAGRPVFISNDGLLRDSGEIHGKIRKSKMFGQAVDNLIQTLKEIHFKEVQILLDEPIPYSADLATAINIQFAQLDIPGKTIVVRYPDYQLKSLKSGIIASSDSVIVDKTPCRILDLARYVLEQHYSPQFISIAGFIRIV